MSFRKVLPEGLEPPTDGLENRCSILLSYGSSPVDTRTLRRSLVFALEASNRGPAERVFDGLDGVELQAVARIVQPEG